MSRTLKEIKVGDRVWISARYGGGDKGEIKTVKRLTPTQIILDGAYEQYNRYQRGKPSRYNGHEPTYYGIGMSSGAITGLATKAECKAWDADVAKQREAQEEAKRKRSADEARAVELQALLPAKARISGPSQNTWGEWSVTIYATEDEVREIGKRLEGILTAPLEEPN